MRKILFYTWITLGIIIGLPIALLILFITFVTDKYQKATCKNNCQMKVKKKIKKRLLFMWLGFLIGVTATLTLLILTNNLN